MNIFQTLERISQTKGFRVGLKSKLSRIAHRIIRNKTLSPYDLIYIDSNYLPIDKSGKRERRDIYSLCVY